MSWMIYGANGYTGELIAREAVLRGERPVLAGRNASKVEALARELGCAYRVFDLARPELEGVRLVLHCAGPFVHTSRPMVDACLEARVHYLDITGEIRVFESIFARDAEAGQRGVTLLPGVGFDVVPTDCLAAMLHQRMPDAQELWLAFASVRGGISRGTLKTTIEGVGWGGAIRQNGRIVAVPHLYDVREIPFPSRSRTAMTIPWGDISTAYRTTGIPNIRVYAAQSRKGVALLRRTRSLLPLLRSRPVRGVALWFASRRSGPSVAERAAARTELWGRVTNARGDEVAMTMTVAEGYTFTVLSALEAVRGVLSSPRAGAFTPAAYFGAGFVTRIPGTRL